MHSVCIHCSKDVDPSWSFCPECGADNRDPLNRADIPAHQHSFVNGTYCVICGKHSADVFDAAPKGGYSFSTEYLGKWFGVLMLFIFGFSLYEQFFDHQDYKGKMDLFWPYGAILFLCLSILGFLARQRTYIDVKSQTVRRINGLWPFVIRQVVPFSQVTDVRLRVVRSIGRYGYRYNYYLELLYIKKQGAVSTIFLTAAGNSLTALELSTTAREMGITMQKPVSDESQMVANLPYY